MKRFLVCLLVLFISVPAVAANYYIGPLGSDGNSGTSPTWAWRTLNKARTFGLSPGDTVFLLGGHHATGQFYEERGSTYNTGLPGRPIVFKAYGDSTAYLTLSGGTSRAGRPFFYWANGQDYIVIDGKGKYGAGDTLMIHMDGKEDASYVVRFIGTATNRTIGTNIKYCEVDGNYPSAAMVARGHTAGGLLRYAVGWVYGDRDTLLGNYIHDVYHPTGIAAGDSTDNSQGTGESLMLESSNFTYISRNKLVNANHALISFNPTVGSSSYPPCFGVKIVNNKCSNSWGGGIYGIKDEYCLIDQNIIAMPQTSTTKTKGPIGVGGEHLSIRRNVIYNPYNLGGIDINAALGLSGIGPYNFDSSLVYNNVIYKTKGYDIHLLVNNTGVAGGATSHGWDATVANNIMYRGRLRNPDIGAVTNPWFTSLKLWLYNAANAYNWVDPDARDVLPSSTNFGGNRFFNNCMLRDSVGAGYTRIIGYVGSPAEGNPSRGYSVSAAQALDPIAFHGNIEFNPLLKNAWSNRTESLDTLFSDWWKINWDSPCIDRGAPVADYNGAYVDSLYPGYGWDTLAWYGQGPDIGAFEYGGTTQAPSNLLIQPNGIYEFGEVLTSGNETLGVWVKNDCTHPCDSVIVNPVIVGAPLARFNKIGTFPDTLWHGDSISVNVRYHPTGADTLHTAKIVMYSGALDTTWAWGIGRSGASTCCVFNYSLSSLGEGDTDWGDLGVGSTVRDTIDFWNCGTGTLPVNITLKTGLAFEIVSGGGIDTLATLAHKNIIIDFNPYTIGVFSDSLLSGETSCPGIKLIGEGVAKESTKPRFGEEE